MFNYEQFSRYLNDIFDNRKSNIGWPCPSLENDGEFIAVPFLCLPNLFPASFVDFEHTIPARICDGYIAINTFNLADILDVEPSDLVKLFK